MATPPKPPTQQTRVDNALLQAKTTQLDEATRLMFTQLPQAQQIEISQMAEADRAAATKRLYSKYQGLLKQFPGLQRERQADPGGAGKQAEQQLQQRNLEQADRESRELQSRIELKARQESGVVPDWQIEADQRATGGFLHGPEGIMPANPAPVFRPTISREEYNRIRKQQE